MSSSLGPSVWSTLVSDFGSDPEFSDAGYSWPTGDQDWVAACSPETFEPALRSHHAFDLQAPQLTSGCLRHSWCLSTLGEALLPSGASAGPVGFSADVTAFPREHGVSKPQEPSFCPGHPSCCGGGGQDWEVQRLPKSQDC